MIYAKKNRVLLAFLSLIIISPELFAIRALKSKADFNAAINQTSGCVVIKFFATWCPPCTILAKTLVEAKNWKIDIDGHTDDKGSDSFNQKLSQDRANAVKSYLVSKGVTADTIIATGFGETKPIVKNDSDANRERNRRVEFKITKPNNEVITIKA